MTTKTEERDNFKPASAPPTMTEAESEAWRPELKGWAADILGAYRQLALELPNPCTVVEIGSAHGRSAIYLAQELVARGHGSHSRIFMVDDWGGGWFAECLPSIVKHATAAELEILRPLRTTSERAARMFDEDRDPVDLVFIDGDHSRIAVANDLETWWRPLRRGGALAGHDYDLKAHPGVVGAVDEFAKKHELTLERPTRSVWRLR